MKKAFFILFAFISVLALSQVPQRFNKVIVTGDIVSPKFIKTGSTSDSVLLGNGSARAISTIKTDTVSLSNRINAKAAGNGTANGTNTGDETLTSIKTKLGAATAVSDGYLRYQDFALLHTPTTVAASNGLSISGQNISLQAASLTQSGALTFNDWNTFNSKEPAITKNTGFNKNFGTTPGTVSEGRTFGTAANSEVGDFIQNKNTSAQSANMWINGIIKTVTPVAGWAGWLENTAVGGSGLVITASDGIGGLPLLVRKKDATEVFSINNTGAATFSSTVNSTGFLLNGNNLTSSLTTNYIPKWNGSSFVNSLVYDSGSSIGIGTTATPRKFCITSSDPEQLLLTSTSNTSGLFVAPANSSYTAFIGGTGNDLIFNTTGNTRLRIASGGEVNIYSTSTSTSPTTGALVVNGGIGADHVRANNFYGNGSNLTGVQLPITLTTNGTSGAATFSGNVLNVPNYDVSGGVDQTQTTFNGSTSGTIVCSMPFQTGSYKKVMIIFSSLNGNGTSTYTYPVAFTNDPAVILYNYTGTPASTTLGKSSIIFSGTASNYKGCMILEGY